jgi:hypothetical protein
MPSRQAEQGRRLKPAAVKGVCKQARDGACRLAEQVACRAAPRGALGSRRANVRIAPPFSQSGLFLNLYVRVLPTPPLRLRIVMISARRCAVVFTRSA